MTSGYFRFFLIAAITSLTACGGASTPPLAPAGPAALAPAALTPAVSTANRVAVEPLSARALTAGAVDCSTVALSVVNGAGTAAARCSHVQLAAVAYGPTTPANLVPGYHPADLQSAYNLPSATAGTNQTIAIVTGGHDPNAESDLAVYRTTFGLPACTLQSGCLRQIRVNGAPAADVNWAAETAIDLEMASAVCPNCRLLLVEAKSTAAADLANAVTAAVANGAGVVSNSYVIAESASMSDAQWYHPGVAIVAASGDTGYQSVANWPAASSHVIAVGGTSLTRSANARGWSETAWSRSGSACSTTAPKPAWQTDTGCSNRTVADVAAVADPATPVAVYDSYQNVGWVKMAGTSVAAPIVAGIYALAGNASTVDAAASIYAHPAALFAVQSGVNGNCSVGYLCAAGAGYSGPAGLGSPNGVAAF